jgi:hypothetical protein
VRRIIKTDAALCERPPQDLGHNAAGHSGKMNKLKQIFISQAFVVEGERPVDRRWERCISGAGSTAIALTKGELPGRMKMLRCMCDSGWAGVSISGVIPTRSG